ncbi:3-keto-5-aminohexanoate cleavage protein [Burkholderia territorii]|uniref:3-keto-5-aminohexanoate cleavage protein n=1 Tax=Burkholderia territorii TaxID=1503055 RepID=A0A6L3NL39_9BURK|nr:3-keto-5-aminohexanoate cleavage protein [Burkholderia territorii]KAB0684969.1 3-keto-5-aminohexanoate cleavage protein [Burkholderia territorii]MBM2773549.1 3-keto-5-aminohexanoate cleavage protein [Burkholderia territorii]VWC18001.1 methionyl-tRNA synthetase [Burkholderia territorii]
MHARKTIITCAVTGNITRPDQHPGLPVTPEQIANASLEAAQAGAAVVHIHVRDPATGRPSMDVDLYRDVMARIRAVDRELIINLTTGPGGRFIPSDDDPKMAAPGTTLLPPDKRVEHILALRPDICSLDLNTMNSGSEVVINTPKNVTRMAEAIRRAGVKPELEIFDSGDIHLARDLIASGVLDGPGLWAFVSGVKYGFAASPETLLYVRGLLPPGAIWSAFGIGRFEFPIVAQAWLAGGHVRVGLEDNIYIEKGVLAESNAALVARAREIVALLGGEIATSRDARECLGLAS